MERSDHDLVEAVCVKPAICLEKLSKTFEHLRKEAECPSSDSGSFEFVPSKQYYATDSLEVWVGFVPIRLKEVACCEMLREAPDVKAIFGMT